MEHYFLPLPTSQKIAKSIGCKRYFNGKPCAHGHVVYRLTSTYGCSECCRLNCARWQRENPEKLKESHLKSKSREGASEIAADSGRLYRKRNKEKVLQWKRNYRKRNPIAARKSVIAWLDKNPGYKRDESRRRRASDIEKSRAYMREYKKFRFQNDPDYAMNATCRSILRRTLKQSGCPKTNNTCKMLGYSGEALRKHIEKQFLPGMSWSNYGEWQIDHVISVAEMLRLGIKDPAKINALSNLTPLWKEDNQAKSDRFNLSAPVLL